MRQLVQTASSTVFANIDNDNIDASLPYLNLLTGDTESADVDENHPLLRYHRDIIHELSVSHQVEYNNQPTFTLIFVTRPSSANNHFCIMK
jgi:hypothetical protein